MVFDDLRPAVHLAHSLVDAGISVQNIVFALVKTTHSETEVEAARAYLKQTEYKTLGGFLPVSTAYGIAHDGGKAITETPYVSLNKKAAELAQSMIDQLAFITEKKRI